MYNLPIVSKFFLKCLATNDEIRNVLLQLEVSTSHPWYQHITYLRQYSAWKRNYSRSTRAISIMLLDENIYHYTKIDMSKFLNHCWNKCMETILVNSVPLPLIRSENTNLVKSLFNKRTRRDEDTAILEFIHGHSSRFNNFMYSIGKSTTKQCKHCKFYLDSPGHQLFDCPKFDGEARAALINNFEDVSLYQFQIVSSTDYNLINAFKAQVAHIKHTTRT